MFFTGFNACERKEDLVLILGLLNSMFKVIKVKYEKEEEI